MGERTGGQASKIAILALFLALLALASACGGEETPQVIYVTATPAQEQATAVKAATPTPVVIVVTATPSPEPQIVVTATPSQPTLSPEDIATAQAVLTAQAADLTAMAMATSTDTPVPPTDTPIPTVEQATAAPTATTKPAASLASYGLIYSNFDGGSERDAVKYTVWVVRGDGSSATKILETATMPAFSPNGQKIAYYKTFEGIAVYDLKNKTTTMAVPNNWAEFASFSPDGKQLVFHEWVGNWWSADVSLYVVNVDGSGRYKLVPGERPVWSPKGDLIAFDSCQNNNCGIFVVKSNGQGMRQVTSDAGGNAAWSPDGKKIAYCSSVDGDAEIWVVNVDGSGVRQLTKNTGNDTNPAFSPDGNYIFYLSDQNGTAWALRVMRPDGSDIKTLRKVGTAPRWQFARMWAGWW
ncbi:MAG: PD40 domain-containing protein [Anaerolineae bacterium]|nr:PD40 domain-containing protein [Anaerolineae bacterium]